MIMLNNIYFVYKWQKTKNMVCKDYFANFKHQECLIYNITHKTKYYNLGGWYNPILKIPNKTIAFYEKYYVKSLSFEDIIKIYTR